MKLEDKLFVAKLVTNFSIGVVVGTAAREHVMPHCNKFEKVLTVIGASGIAVALSRQFDKSWDEVSKSILVLHDEKQSE